MGTNKNRSVFEAKAYGNVVLTATTIWSNNCGYTTMWSNRNVVLTALSVF